jgi:hypothetical protein
VLAPEATRRAMAQVQSQDAGAGQSQTMEG